MSKFLVLLITALGAAYAQSNGSVTGLVSDQSAAVVPGARITLTNTATGVERPPETGTSTCEICDYNSDKKGLSLFDTTHAFAVSYAYTLPFFSGATGLKKALFSGWQISGLTSLQSGTPYHMHTGSDGPGLGNVDGWGQDRPNIKDPSLLGKSFDDPDTSPILLGAASCTRVAGGFSVVNLRLEEEGPEPLIGILTGSVPADQHNFAVTPNDRMFVRNNLLTPDLQVTEHRLTIKGLVDR